MELFIFPFVVIMFVYITMIFILITQIGQNRKLRAQLVKSNAQFFEVRKLLDESFEREAELRKLCGDYADESESALNVNKFLSGVISVKDEIINKQNNMFNSSSNFKENL